MSDPWLPYARHRHAVMDAAAPAADIVGVFASYPATRQLVLRDVSLTVGRGSRIALVGANGSGKSTLLKTLAGFITPTAGTIRLFGNPPGHCHHRIAYLPQRGDLDWTFPVSVERLVLTGRYVRLGWLRRPRSEDRDIATMALARLGLTELARRPIGQLSGGQQQRALLARALAQEAELYLLDEPLAAVDTETRTIISEVLNRLKDDGKSVLAATHDLDRLERDFDDVLLIRNGTLVPMQELAWTG